MSWEDLVFKFTTTYNLRAFKGGEQPVSHRKLTTHLPLPQALWVLWKPVAFWQVKGVFKVLHVDIMKLCCRCDVLLNVFFGPCCNFKVESLWPVHLHVAQWVVIGTTCQSGRWIDRLVVSLWQTVQRKWYLFISKVSQWPLCLQQQCWRYYEGYYRC